jgi:hypothetical protein
MRQGIAWIEVSGAIQCSQRIFRTAQPKQGHTQIAMDWCQMRELLGGARGGGPEAVGWRRRRGSEPDDAG